MGQVIMKVIGLATTHPKELIANADWVVGSFAEIELDALPFPDR